MWSSVCEIYSPLAEEKKDELDKFTTDLNTHIQRLSLEKKEVIKIIESIYR